jgi:hypothetical protein
VEGICESQACVSCANAKTKNCVKDLHYKACSYLTSNYDTIILLEFQSKEMLKPSSSRTHAFNEALLGLKHYASRQLLSAKCKLLRKTLVVCSKMYTGVDPSCTSASGRQGCFTARIRTVATRLDAM